MYHQLIPYELRFKKPFRLAHGTRTGTKALFLVLEHQGYTGYGEATFPPYLPETVENCTQQLKNILPLAEKVLEHSPDQMHLLIDGFNLSPFARNVFANALVDLYLKLHQLTSAVAFGLSVPGTAPAATFTLTKGDELTGEKLETARNFSMLKLKLDGVNDIGFAEAVKTAIDRPFCVDVNQGWEKLGMEESILLTEQLKALGCVLVEQPFGRENHQAHSTLSQMKILPVFADEGIQDAAGFHLHGHCYDGINVKLLKCGGIDKALVLAQLVREAGKEVIVGCMSESSCGCAIAYALAPLAHYLDLDGPWLVSNDPFTGLTINNGKLNTGEMGFGVKPSDLLWL